MIRLTASLVLGALLAAGCLGEASDRGAPSTASQHGRAITVEGTLEVLHADDSTGAKYWFSLETADGTLKLRFRSGMPTHVRTSDRVRVTGVRLGADELLVDTPADVQPIR